MQSPCDIFVTFENEEGYNRALKLNQLVEDGILKPHFEHLLGDKLEIEPATEPTDIIWENRHLTNKIRRRRNICVSIVILLMLCASGSVIFVLSTKNRRLKMMYPLTDCVAPEAKYIGANSKSNFKEWQTDAVNEFFNNRDIKTNRIKMKTDYTDVY